MLTSPCIFFLVNDVPDVSINCLEIVGGVLHWISAFGYRKCPLNSSAIPYTELSKNNIKTTDFVLCCFIMFNSLIHSEMNSFKNIFRRQYHWLCSGYNVTLGDSRISVKERIAVKIQTLMKAETLSDKTALF